MALSKLTKDMAIIQKLEDEPNDVGGLTADELKAKFDEAGEAIKEFLNETLLPELGGDQAADSLGAVLNGEQMSVQQALDLLQLASLQSGNVPVGGSAGDTLLKTSDELYDMQWRPLLTETTAALFGLDADAAPDDAFHTIASVLADRVQIAAGSYVGTGVYGADNPNSLTFPFTPKIVFIANSANYQSNSKYCATYIWGTEEFSGCPGALNYYCRVVVSGSTMTWWGAHSGYDDANSQLNASGTTYMYVAIGLFEG